MPKVYVNFRNTRSGRSSIQYALDAAHLFSDEPLIVLVERDSRAETVLGEAFSQADNALSMNVHRAVCQMLGNEDAPIAVKTYDVQTGPEIPPGSILVDPTPREDANFHCIHPADEPGVERGRPGPVLITFSDGDTGLTAAEAAFDLIVSLRDQRQEPYDGPDVVFYHTTWRHPNAISCDPVDHLCDSAVRMMLALEKEARDRGLRYKTIIETHRDVAVGVLEAANREGVVMIAMDRSEQVSDGSYVDQILAQTAVPVFVASPDTQPICETADDKATAAHYAERRAIVEARPQKKAPAVLSRLLNHPILANPLFVMGLVATMYIYKGASKIAVGWWVGLPTLLPDGLHNAIADLPEALIVMTAIIIARRPSNKNYPLGMLNVESFASVFIGVLLYLTAGVFILDCALGLLSYWSTGDEFVRSYLTFLPAVDHTVLNPVEFKWVMIVSVSSMILSMLVSRYQIVIGNRTGHGSMVADGKETATDGWIEAVTIVGVVLEHFFQARAVEFFIGPIVAVLIFRTAGELFVFNWKVLLQHSIGKNVEDALKKAAMNVAGVLEVTDLITFQIGHKAVVLMTFHSWSRSQALPFVKEAVEEALKRCVIEIGEFKVAQTFVITDQPDPANSRIGFPLNLLDENTGYVAASLATATHIAICDIVYPDVKRTKVAPLAGVDITELLLDKRFDELAVLDPNDQATRALIAESNDRAKATVQSEVLPETAIVQAWTYTLPPLGVKINRKRAKHVPAKVAA